MSDADRPQKAGGAPRRSIFVRLVRFVAWSGVAIGALALGGMGLVYGPCFMGVPDSCISGVFLLFGGAFGLVFAGAGVLILAITRGPRPVQSNENV